MRARPRFSLLQNASFQSLDLQLHTSFIAPALISCCCSLLQSLAFTAHIVAASLEQGYSLGLLETGTSWAHILVAFPHPYRGIAKSYSAWVREGAGYGNHCRLGMGSWWGGEGWKEGKSYLPRLCMLKAADSGAVAVSAPESAVLWHGVPGSSAWCPICSPPWAPGMLLGTRLHLLCHKLPPQLRGQHLSLATHPQMHRWMQSCTSQLLWVGPGPSWALIGVYRRVHATQIYLFGLLYLFPPALIFYLSLGSTDVEKWFHKARVWEVGNCYQEPTGNSPWYILQESCMEVTFSWAQAKRTQHFWLYCGKLPGF